MARESVARSDLFAKGIQFAVRCDVPSGGALKMRHYFEHVLASEFGGRVSLFMPQDTHWSDANPWLDYRVRVSPTIDWANVGVLVLSGWGWDRFVPERFHKAPPFRVIYLVQSFGRIDPRESQFRHLANPAIRICVSKPLEEELRRLGVANGPVHTIPAGIDLDAMPEAVSAPDEDVLIIGFKRPDVARLLQDSLTQAGVAPKLLMEKRARSDFLAEMARARVVVCLPAVREGFYLPALEAMAVGALTVCPDVRGNDYCEDTVNCFQPEYDVGALTRSALAMSRLSGDRAAAIRRNAKATAKRHDLAIERARFLALLRDAL